MDADVGKKVVVSAVLLLGGFGLAEKFGVSHGWRGEDGRCKLG